MSTYQPYIEQIVLALIGLIVLFVMVAAYKIWPMASAWITAHTTAKQREQLATLAQEGMALAEAAYKDYGGPDKLNQAINYVAARIAWSGVDADDIKAAVEKAVLDYNAKVKGQQPAVKDSEVPV